MKPNSPVSGGLGGRALSTGWTVWHSPMGASAPKWTPPADAPMTCALPMRRQGQTSKIENSSRKLFPDYQYDTENCWPTSYLRQAEKI
jgi:hypothetical protein